MSNELIGHLSGKLAATALRAAECRRRLAEIRRILAPLLDDPLEPVVGADWVGAMRCRFCDARMVPSGYLRHGAGCATHRTETLLGRTEG